jgi:adenine/guanine phosphoribosyltransferase-like PRPP-binding protein
LFQTLAEGLAKDHNIVVITRKLKKTKTYEVINGVHVHRVRTFGSRYLFTFLALPKILKIAKDADIINTTTYNAAPPARWAARWLKKPCILTVHEVLGDRWYQLHH